MTIDAASWGRMMHAVTEQAAVMPFPCGGGQWGLKVNGKIKKFSSRAEALKFAASAVKGGEKDSEDASLAPYKILKQGDEFVVKNNAGMVKAKFKTRPQALDYLRALYANVKGAPKQADKTKWTGKAPVPKKG